MNSFREKLMRFMYGRYGIDEIVYVSCNPKTLCINLDSFRANGYEIKSVKAFDNFPMTKHVEACCLLSRKDVNKRSYVSLDVEMEDYYRIKNETEVTTDATE